MIVYSCHSTAPSWMKESSLGRIVAAKCDAQSFTSVGAAQAALGEPATCLTNPYTYTAREFDTESGLYYYRARHYDAAIGRFLQEDPVVSLPQYAYVGNAPHRFVDPLGLQEFNFLELDSRLLRQHLADINRQLLQTNGDLALVTEAANLRRELAVASLPFTASSLLLGPLGGAAAGMLATGVFGAFADLAEDRTIAHILARQGALMESLRGLSNELDELERRRELLDLLGDDC